MKTEAYIRKHIRKILLEETESSDAPSKKTKRPQTTGKIVTKSGAVGSGNWSGKVKGAALLAETDPGKLMGNLKVSSVNAQKNQFAILENILRQAVENTEEMSEVYKILKATAKDKDGNALKSVNIGVDIIPYRNAHKYIEWTLVGATKAFGIKWATDVILDKAGSNIVVYFK